MLRRFLSLLFVFAFTGIAIAVEPGDVLADPAMEARARAISAELRCLVCQNESIDDSAAPLAGDLRRLVRQRLTAGDTDEQVKDYIVARYGEFVLLRPRVEPGTWLLWFGPFLAVLLGLIGIVLYARRRAASHAAPTLTDEEERRLREIVNG